MGPRTEKVGGPKGGCPTFIVSFSSATYFALWFSLWRVSCVCGSRTTEIVRLGFSGNPNGTRRPQERHLWREDTKKSERRQYREGRSREGEVQGKAQKSTTPQALSHTHSETSTHRETSTHSNLTSANVVRPTFFFRLWPSSFANLGVPLRPIGRSRNWPKSKLVHVEYPLCWMVVSVKDAREV